jgi:hypothetical protein
MHRYYLHLWIGQTFAEDPDGNDYADVSAAHANALALFREMPEGWLGLKSQDLRMLAIEITDEAGQTLRVVPYSEAEGQRH